jgi:hypothetical protein
MAIQKLHNASRITPSEIRLLTHCHATKQGSSLTSARLTHWSKHTLNQREGKSNTASCTYNVTFRHVCISVFWTLNRLSYYLSHRGHIAVHILYTYYLILRLLLRYDVILILKTFYMSTLVLFFIKFVGHTEPPKSKAYFLYFMSILEKHWIWHENIYWFLYYFQSEVLHLFWEEFSKNLL